MPRLRTIVAGTLVIALGASLFTLCGRESAPPVKHIVIADRVGTDLVGPSRASEQHIALDQRDAFTQVLGKDLELHLAARGDAHVLTAAALIPSDGVVVPDKGRITFVCEWENAGSTTAKAETTVDALSATATWTPFELDLKQPLKRRSTLRLRAVSAEGAPALPPGVRVAWAVPQVRGYSGVPLSSVPEGVARAHEKGPNVLLISIDTLRADHLSCYGYERATTPNIDALAQQGVLFEQATSSASWTLPSYGSLFTGLDPGRHYAGMSRERELHFCTDAHEQPKRSVQPLRDDVPTLAELFRDAGWHTAAFVNNVFLLPTYGLSRGFQRYTQYQYNAVAGVENARHWILAQDRPWLCFAHFMDPHVPYCPPEPWDSKFTNDPLADHMNTGWPPPMQSVREHGLGPDGRKLLVGYYDGEIAFTDDQVGRLLRELDAAGALENTIVIIHSDHGEEFWDHDGYEHGHSQYQELLHVPLIVRFPPRFPAKLRVSSRVRTMDLFPTLLELAGIGVPAGIDAQSLLPLLDGQKHPARDVLSEFLLWGDHEIKARIVGERKLITNGASENELYDLGADPREQHNVAHEQAAHVNELRAGLCDHHVRTLREAPPPVIPKLRDGEMQLQKGFGYDQGADDAPPAPPPSPSPGTPNAPDH